MIVGLLGGSAVIVAVMVFNGTDLSTSLRAVWLPAIPAAMFGSAAGVSIGRHFGWHPRWVSGAVFAAILAIAATIGFVMFVVSQLGG
jgi:hypothetical protein